MATRASYTQMQVFCVACSLIFNLTHIRQIPFLHLSPAVVLIFRRDSLNVITATTLCSPLDVIPEPTLTNSLRFVDIYTCVLGFGSVCASPPQSKELVNFELHLH